MKFLKKDEAVKLTLRKLTEGLQFVLQHHQFLVGEFFSLHPLWHRPSNFHRKKLGTQGPLVI